MVRQKLENPVIVTTQSVAELAGRLDNLAEEMIDDRPSGADDVSLASRILRHALKAGWIHKSVVS